MAKIMVQNMNTGFNYGDFAIIKSQNTGRISPCAYVSIVRCVIVSLLMFWGIVGAWAETIDFNLPNGYYYLGNEAGNNSVPQYNGSNFEANYYMCPAYSSTVNVKNYLGGDSGKPLITTFKSFPNNGKTYSYAVWYIEAATGDDVGYFYIKHRDSNQYLVANDNTSPAETRRRVNLGPTTNPGKDGLFKIQSDDNGTTFYIYPKEKHYIDKDKNDNKYLSPSNGNKDNLSATSQNGDTGGILGFWYENNKNSAWHFVSVPCSIPRIAYNITNNEVTITNTEGSTFYYTTDGSTDPNPNEVGGSYPTKLYDPDDKPIISAQTTIKAIAVHTGYANSEIATATIYYNLTVTLTPSSGIYDGTAKTVTVSVVDGSTPIANTKYEVSYQKENDVVSEFKDAGTYTVIVSDVEGDDEIVSGTQSFVISPLTATLSWENTSLPYNKTTQKPTATVGNLVSGDACTVTVSIPEGDGISVGTYTATATGLSNSNYALPDVTTQEFSVTEKEVTFSGITAEDKVYDKTTAATLNYSSVTFDGLIEGDALTISATGAFSDANAGEDKTVTISAPVLGGGSVANYQLAGTGQQTTTTADINKKSVTVGAITANNKVYDGTTTAALNCSSATFDGIIAGDVLTVTATGTFADANVDDGITVTISDYVLGGESVANYELAASGHQASTTANITVATLTITADAKTKSYGDPDPELTYTSTGLGEGDVLADILNDGALTRAAGEEVGSYAIGQGTIDLVSNSGNYTLSYVGANLTITRKSLNEGTELAEGITIEITKEGDAYVPVVKNNGTAIVVGTEGTSYDYSLSTTGSPNTKYYEVTISGANNYSGSATVKYANYKSGKNDTSDDDENWSGTFVSDSGDGDIAIPSGMSAYIVTGNNGNVVEVDELDYIPEDEPVLLLSNDFAYCFVVKTNVGEGTNDTSGNLLEKATGTESERTMAVGTVYIVYNGEFVLNMAGVLNEGAVYLPKSAITGSAPAPARLLIRTRNGLSGIKDVDFSPLTTPNLNWYTLDGRRLSGKPTRKGIYLQNGQKVVVK